MTAISAVRVENTVEFAYWWANTVKKEFWRPIRLMPCD